MDAPFRVGITRDLLLPDRTPSPWAVGLDPLWETPGVETAYLAENVPELRPDLIAPCDGLAVMAPRATAASLADADRLLVLARLGVGYDNVDVAACTERGVALAITPDGVRRPLATAILTLLLALAHRLPEKDRLTRAGRWHDRLGATGTGLVGRTLGMIGVGNVGAELLRLVQPLGMRHLAYDPYAAAADPALGVESIDLDPLLAESDFVVVACPLTPETHHLLDARRLALLKPTAYLINAARGPIVDQAALTDALRERRFAGAGLDVFETEPPDPADPIFALDNVIVAPHALCWTDDCLRDVGRSAAAAILAAAAGRVPNHVVNKEVLETPLFRDKLRRWADRAAPSAVGD